MAAIKTMNFGQQTVRKHLKFFIVCMLVALSSGLFFRSPWLSSERSQVSSLEIDTSFPIKVSKGDLLWSCRMLFQTDELPSDSSIESTELASAIKEIAGNSVETTDWNSFTKKFAVNMKTPVVLENNMGQVACLMDAFEFDGQMICLLAQPGAKPVALLKSQFFEGQWTTAAWLREDSDKKNVYKYSLRSVSARASIDDAWISLGFIDPLQTSQAVYAIANDFDCPLKILQVHRSCGCVGIESTANRSLQPQEEVQFSVSLTAPATGGIIRQAVVLELRPLNTEDIIRKRVNLVAWSPSTVMPIPNRIDFGTLSLEDAKRRSPELAVRLSQTVSDQFQIESIDTGDMPIMAKLKEKESGGLVDYILTLTLELNADSEFDFTDGSTSDMHIRVNTTSKWRPKIDIPVRFKVLSNIDIRPGVINFGVIQTGSEVEPLELIVSHRNGVPINVKIASSPDGFNTHTSSKGESSSKEVAISATPTQPGSYLGDIVINVDWEDGHESRRVPCSMFARYNN